MPSARACLANYLQVTAPPPDERGALPTRLALNVAVLFGIDVADNATGLTWAGDYNEVTLLEVSRGAPTPGRRVAFHVPGMQGADTFAIARRVVQKVGASRASVHEPTAVKARRVDLDLIAPTTLNDYGPDTKAATVLVGSNVLFDTLRPVLADVFDLLCTKDDGRPVDDLTRLLIWAWLISETFRCQPALFTAAVQARGVQRAVSQTIAPKIDTALGELSATAEFRADRTRRPDDKAPTLLGLLDETLVLPQLRRRLAAAKIRTDASESDGVPQDAQPYDMAIRRIVVRCVELLYRVPDGAITRVAAEAADGRRWVQALVPFVNLSSGLLQEVVLGDLSQPGGTQDDTVVPRWNFGDESNLEDLIPHLPTVGELRRLPPRSRVACLSTWAMLCRVLRNLPERRPGDADEMVAVPRLWRKRIEDLLLQLQHLADEVMGPQHETSVVLRGYVANYAMQEVRDDTPALHGIVQDGIDSVVDLQHEVAKGTVEPGQFTELWVAISSNMNNARRRLAADDPLAEKTWSFFIDTWRSARDGWPVWHSASHNFAGALVADPGPGLTMVREGVLLARDEVLPLRRRVDRMRQAGSSTRLTLQVMIRGLVRLVAVDDSEDWWDQLDSAVRELAAIYARRLGKATAGSSGGMEKTTQTQANTLIRLLTAIAVQQDHGRPTSLDNSEIEQFAECLDRFAAEHSMGTRVASHADIVHLVQRVRKGGTST